MRPSTPKHVSTGTEESVKPADSEGWQVPTQSLSILDKVVAPRSIGDSLDDYMKIRGRSVAVRTTFVVINTSIETEISK